MRFGQCQGPQAKHQASQHRNTGHDHAADQKVHALSVSLETSINWSGSRRSVWNFFGPCCVTYSMNIQGRVGGMLAGYDLNLELEGNELDGRIGGSVIGKDVDLQVQSGSVSGRIGGQINGFDVQGSLNPSGVQLRFGGSIGGDDLILAIHEGVATGRFSGSLLGKDVYLQSSGSGVTGRIGGEFEGKDVNLIGSAAFEIMALSAVIAYKTLEDDQSSAATSNGSS
jgi:hypothetical protein